MTTARYFVSRSFRAENKFPREFSKDLLKSIDFYFFWPSGESVALKFDEPCSPICI